MTNIAIAYPLRGWLNYMLRETLLTLAVPAFNAEINNQMLADPGRQSQPNFILPKLTENTVRIGELHSLKDVTLSVVSGGNVPASGAPTNTAYRSYKTRFLWKIPQAGLNASEDYSMVQGVFEDLFTNLFLDISRYLMTPMDPTTNAPALPAGAGFPECLLGSVVPMPMPVKTADGVTRVEGGFCDLTCFFQWDLDRPGRIG